MDVINIFRILTSILFFYNTETPYELYSIANQLELAGKTESAIEYYKKALLLDPQAIEIYLSLANAFYKLRKFDDGIDYANQGLLVVPDNKKLYLTIGTGYIGKGDFKKAIEFYQKASGFEPENIEIYSAISTLYEALDDLNMAKKTLQDIPEEFKTSEVYTKLGTIAGKLNDHPGAIEFYHKGYDLDTTNATALVGIGTGFDFMGIKDSSIYYYEKAIANDSFLMVSKRLVDLYSDTDQYEKLINIARKILSYEYYETAVRRSLGYALYKIGAAVESLNEFYIASSIDPQDTYSKFYVARIYLEQGRYDDAQREISETIRINPDFIELWVYLGFICIDKKDFKTARAAFTEAAHRGADLVQIYYLLGVTAEMELSYTEAYFYYKKSLALNSKSLPSLEALANLCDRIDKKNEAFIAFQKIIELDTINPVALNYVGYTYAERAESLDYALSLIEQALSFEANNGYYIDSRGWVFYQLQRYEEALTDLKRASEIVEDAVILEHLGDVYLKLNDLNNAKDAYERALKLEPKNEIINQKLQQLNK